MKNRNTKAMKKMLKRRGDIHADAKLRGYNKIMRFIGGA